MKPGGFALVILGALVVCQILGGQALERLKIVGS